MKKIRKLFSLLLIFTITLSSINCIVFADNSETIITVDKVYGSPEGTVAVNVIIENNPGILGAVFSFSFDNDSLTLINAKAGDAFSSLVMSKPGKFTSPCQFAWDGESIKEEDIKDGIILTLTFKISENAIPGSDLDINISYNRGDIVDSNLKVVNPQTVSGIIQVIDYTPGDVDGDKVINAKDLVLLRRYITGGYDLSINEYAGDVNDDGKINTTDVILIRRYIAGGYGVKLRPSHGLHEHIMEEFAYKDATCKEEGNIAYWHCTYCDNYYIDEEGIEETALENTVIEKSEEHTVVIDEAIAPTTKESGLTEGSHCSVCETVLVPQKVLPPYTGYPITYNISNGEDYIGTQDVSIPLEKYEYSSELGLELPQLYVPGYKFIGWSRSQSSSMNLVTHIEPGEKGAQEFFAHWEIIEYTVTFDSPDIPWNEITYTVNKGATLTNPSCFGYTFMGWSNDDGFIISRIKPGTTGHMTLHANWTSDRNKATSYKNYGDPIIIEDNNNGQFLFVYNIGKIDNVPLSEVEFIGKSEGLTYKKEIGVSNYIDETFAENINKMTSNATTKSSGWTLSKEWNDIYETKEEVGQLSEKSDERTTSEGTTVGGKYFISNSQGGSTYISTESGSSSSNSSKITTENSMGINASYDKSTEKYCDAKLGVTNSTELSAGVEVPVKIAKVSAGVKNTTTVGAEVSNGRKDNTAFHIDGSFSSYVGTVDTNDSSQYYNSSASNTSTWNSTTGYEQSRETSIDNTVTNAIKEQISKTTSHNLSKALGGEDSKTQTIEDQNITSNEYSTNFIYAEGTKDETIKTVEFNSSETGYYRLITAGTVHVYAVVGYDIATSSYYTYCFNVLDDNIREIMDYSKDNMNFNDCENSVVTFEVPYEVNEYIAGVVGKTEGLVIGYDGKVTEFNPTSDFDGTVVIPQYDGKNNQDGTFTSVKVTSFDSNTFKIKIGEDENGNAIYNGNDKIKTVILPMYITEIPDNAFEGCSNLETVIAYGITKIGKNAFKGCVSLKKFSIDNKIVSLGENAFGDVEEVAVCAYDSNVADVAIKCGAINISLDISKIEDTYNNKVVNVPDTTNYFALIGNGNIYTNLQIISNANQTMISNMIFANNLDTPITSSSKTITLARLTVENSPGFALILTSDNIDLKLLGIVTLNSSASNTILSKSVNLAKADVGTSSSLTINGNYLVCGNVTNTALLNVTPTKITDEEYLNYRTCVTVIFDTGYNGNLIDNSKVFYGQTYGILPIPTRDNYTFDGWYTAIDNGTKITADSEVKYLVDHTLFAKWKPNTFTVTYNANGGVISTTSKTLTFGDSYGTLPTPTRDYYTFNGWYTAPEGGTQITSNTVISSSENITLYAHWTLNPISDWVNASSVPTNAQIINRKYTYDQTQYRTHTSSSLPGSGWTPYDSSWVWSAYGDWNNWSDTYVASSDSREVSQRTLYRYYRWHQNGTTKIIYCESAGIRYYGGSWYKEYYGGADNWFTSPVTPYAYNEWYCGSHNGEVFNEWRLGGSSSAYSYYCEDTKIQYCYRERYKIYTYYFYKIENKESNAYPNEANISNIQEWVQYRAK